MATALNCSSYSLYITLSISPFCSFVNAALSFSCATFVLSTCIYTPPPASAICLHIPSLSADMTSAPELSFIYPPCPSGIKAPFEDPTPKTKTFIPFFLAAAAASSAPPSWSSPSVITMIARPMLSAFVKLLDAILIASAMSVP